MNNVKNGNGAIKTKKESKQTTQQVATGEVNKIITRATHLINTPTLEIGCLKYCTQNEPCEKCAKQNTRIGKNLSSSVMAITDPQKRFTLFRHYCAFAQKVEYTLVLNNGKHNFKGNITSDKLFNRALKKCGQNAIGG